jgi:hypothetical protein
MSPWLITSFGLPVVVTTGRLLAPILLHRLLTGPLLAMALAAISQALRTRHRRASSPASTS